MSNISDPLKDRLENSEEVVGGGLVDLPAEALEVLSDGIGEVVERGHYDELIAHNGLFAQLATE